jgi:hypothetical protein
MLKPFSDLTCCCQVYMFVPAIGGQPLHPVGRFYAFVVWVEPPPKIAGLGSFSKMILKESLQI